MNRVPTSSVRWHRPTLVRIESPLAGSFASVPVLPTQSGTPQAVASHDAWLDQLVQERALHPDEATLARALHVGRQPAFVGGRLALRAALAPYVPDAAQIALLRTPRGAPTLPDAITGSVSHKSSRAVALVAPRTEFLRHVGVDLERRPIATDLSRPSIARRILTDQEQDMLSVWTSDALAHREQVLVYFAVKEAVYKAIDPLPPVQRYVGFREVALMPTATKPDSGSMAVTLHVPELADSSVQVAAQWAFDGDWIVAQAWSW